MTQERSAIGESGASDIYEHLFLIGRIRSCQKWANRQLLANGDTNQPAVRHGGRMQAIMREGCLEESERAILDRMSHI